MPKTYKIISIVVLSFFISAASCKLCYFIAEKYFFDKFFYQKSIKHGYWPATQKVNFIDFGDRAKDLLSLESKNSNVLGAEEDKSYKIAVIGDSNVWGQGLDNESRFCTRLEKKLNSIRPVKVLSFAMPQLNVNDYYDLYLKVEEHYKPDLYIFSIVGNDAFIHYNYHKNEKETKLLHECLELNNQSEPVYDISEPEVRDKFNINMGPEYDKFISLSWNNPTNICSIMDALKSLPEENAIYFVSDLNLPEHIKYELPYINLLTQLGKIVIPRNIDENFFYEYHKYYKNINKMYVSPKEIHPSAFANQLYTEILFDEITKKSKWGFIN